MSSGLFVGEGKGGFTVTGDGVLGMREEEEEVEEAFGCFDETATIPTTCRLNRLAVYIIDATQYRHCSWISFGFVLHKSKVKSVTRTRRIRRTRYEKTTVSR